MSYATECEAKTGFVRDAFARLGGFDVSSFEFSPVLALTDHTAHYRNKVQLPVGLDADGHVVTGFYAGRTHRIVPCPDCKLQPEWMNALARRACALLEANGIAPYDEETGKGRVRHLYMRQGWHSGQRLLCFVVNGNGLPNEAEICRTLQQEFQLTTVLINRNTARTNVILGRDTRTVLGPGVIEDTLAGVPIRLGQEFKAYSVAIKRDINRMDKAMDEMRTLNMGGTAVGTGINADEAYLKRIVPNLVEISGMDFVQAFDLIDATQNLDPFVAVSGAIKACAVTLSKIANDLRLMSSGPRAGFGEINLPAKQNGSEPGSFQCYR